MTTETEPCVECGWHPNADPEDSALRQSRRREHERHAASRPAHDTRTQHECGVCARVNEAPHCPGCGRCLAASLSLPRVQTRKDRPMTDDARPSEDRLRDLHHSPRCPAQWRCRLPMTSEGSYATEVERAADLAAHFEIYSGTADQLRAALAASRPAPAPDTRTEALTIEDVAGALYETDPPESWMRTGTDEYRKRAAAMLDIFARDAASGPAPDTLDDKAMNREYPHPHLEPYPCRLCAAIRAALAASRPAPNEAGR